MYLIKVLHDLWDSASRLTDERLSHILENPEMSDMETEIGETLLRPEQVARSHTDKEVHLYYRFYPETRVDGKFLCVVVKFREEDAFVITAYLTEKIKRGEVLWSATW